MRVQICRLQCEGTTRHNQRAQTEPAAKAHCGVAQLNFAQPAEKSGCTGTNFEEQNVLQVCEQFCVLRHILEHAAPVWRQIHQLLPVWPRGDSGSHLCGHSQQQVPYIRRESANYCW